MTNLNKLPLMAGSGLSVPRAIVGQGVRADGSDPRAMMAQLQKAFEDFKAANDEKLAAKADVVLDTKVETLNAAVGDLQAAIDQMALKVSAQKADQQGRVIRDPDYTTAFASHVRRGDIQASLNKGTASEGGYLTPVEWDRTITDRLVVLSPMRQLAMVQTISAAGFSKVFNSRGTVSGWVGETAARPETAAPTFGSLTYAPGEIYSNVSATRGLIDDSEVDIESWIAGEVETEFAYQEGLAFLTGNGTNKPNGLLTYVTGAANAAAHPWGAVALQNSGAAATVTMDGILNLIHLLPSAYTPNASFIMNRNSTGAIRKLKDTTNQYLWQPSVIAGQPPTFHGYPVYEMAGMADLAAASKSIAFGDFKRAYMIVDRIGTRLIRDELTNKPYVMFYVTKRVGGGLLDPDAVKVLNTAV